MNATGSLGDLLSVCTLLRYLGHAHVIDERDGARIFLPA